MRTIQTYRKHGYIFSHYTKCELEISRYPDKRIRLELVERSTRVSIVVATMNIGNFQEIPSKLNREVIIKDWGRNEGIYQTLQEYGIISRKKGIKKIGLNEAYICDLLIEIIE